MGSDDDDISPYLKRPLRSVDEVLRQRRRRGTPKQQPSNSDQPKPSTPPAKSA